MINLSNKDRFIFDLPTRVVDIIKEYQTTGKLTIHVNSEGLCLRSAKFYPVLDYICEQFNIEKSKVTIITNNAEEQHELYKISVQADHWIDHCKFIFSCKIESKHVELKHVGCFIGKANWHRLIISAWLYHNYRDSCMQTLHYDPTSERHRIDSEFSDINIQAPFELKSVLKFVDYCPITLDEGFINYTIGPPTHYNIISQYSKIFLDLVSETYISGTTFFPTEKTLRPIIAKTPFIVIGPAGYLSNLQRMGFKTFDQWWDESYDEYSNYERILKIKELLNKIFTWDQDKLHQTLSEMSNILEYNRQHLQKLNSSSVKLNV
jgi:hypothetical protein